MSQQMTAAEVRAAIANYFGQQMPFHQLIGLEIISYEKDSVELWLK